MWNNLCHIAVWVTYWYQYTCTCENNVPRIVEVNSLWNTTDEPDGVGSFYWKLKCVLENTVQFNDNLLFLNLKKVRFSKQHENKLFRKWVQGKWVYKWILFEWKWLEIYTTA